ncbi:MAG TPA: DNA methyltransferase [Armatimonadota bacterium]|nr:DNA methyltransferase [Armatimonadota bacterium]
MPRTPKKSKPKKKQAKKKQAKKKPEKREPTYHPKNSLNELKGDRWIWFTKTHETTNYPLEYGHKLRKTHGANKPPRLMQEQIEYFTKRDGVVLDPFAGVGGTLIGASIADPPRKAIGIEINQEWIDIYDQVCDEHDLVKQEMLRGDCLKVMRDEIEEESIDFIGTDPPYNIHVDQTMCDGKYGWSNRASDYNMRSDEEHDFANLPDYAAYLDAMELCCKECFRVLKKGGWMTIILRNAYQGGRYYLTNAFVAERAEKAGLVLKGEKIWVQGGAPLRPYGYPFSFVPNIVHQFILILQKPKK